MSEELVVILVVGVIFTIFFYMAHRADQVVKEKARQKMAEIKNVSSNNSKKGAKKVG